MDNPYLGLTAEFNRGRLRALLSSGQAVVAHRLAIMSKDGDWILRQDDEATAHVLAVLAAHGARYRFGAPLDCRWLAGGWSAHLEYREQALRIRTDFVTTPPRISPPRLQQLWRDAERNQDPVVGLEALTLLKFTNREKDYAVIGELARKMTDPASQLMYSRSSRDLIELAARHPALLEELTAVRPILTQIASGRDAMDAALDGERRALMRANEERLARYEAAAKPWAAIWTAVAQEIAALPLPEAHARLLERANGVLPPALPGEARA